MLRTERIEGNLNINMYVREVLQPEVVSLLQGIKGVQRIGRLIFKETYMQDVYMYNIFFVILTLFSENYNLEICGY